MATSGSIQNTVTYTTGSAMARVSNTYTVTLNWSVTSASAVSNASTLSWSLTLFLKDAYGASNTGSSSKTYSVVFNGTTFSGSADVGIKRGETKTLASGSVTIPHNEDGTKTFDYSFSQPIAGTATAAASGTATLDTINRIPSLLTATNFTDEGNPTITYSNPAGESIEALEACIANATGKVIYVPYRNIEKNKTEYQFPLTIDERNALRSAAAGSSLQVSFYIRYTLNGKQDWTYLLRTMELEDIEPTLNPLVSDSDEDITALTGGNAIILGYSDIYYDINVTAPSGTSIISKSIKCGAQSSDTTRGTFTDVSSNIIEFSATDSRGNTATERVEVNVVPYVPVSCRQTVRLNKDGTVALTVKGNYFNDSFGAVNNELFVEHRTRKEGEEWSDWTSIHILTDDISNGTYTLYADGGDEYFDPSGTYEFQTRAYDKLITVESAVESDVSSVTLEPVFDWGKYDFNFNVPVSIEGYPLDDFVIETGTDAMYPDNPNNGTWYWRKWKNGRAECYGCRNYGNMAVTTAWGNLFRSESFSQDFPTGLFVDTPEVIDIKFRGADRGGWIANHEETAASDYETGGFILVRPASATLTQAMISFNIIGRWK